MKSHNLKYHRIMIKELKAKKEELAELGGLASKVGKREAYQRILFGVFNIEKMIAQHEDLIERSRLLTCFEYKKENFLTIK